MRKSLKALAASALILAFAAPMQSSAQWWGPGYGYSPYYGPGYWGPGWGRGLGDWFGLGDMFGDFSFSMRGSGSGRGWGRGLGDYYGWHNPYGYGPGWGRGWGHPAWGHPAWTEGSAGPWSGPWTSPSAPASE